MVHHADILGGRLIGKGTRMLEARSSLEWTPGCQPGNRGFKSHRLRCILAT